MSRPNLLTMEGMIWNANHVLDSALSDTTNGIPPPYIRHCKGIILMTVHETGLVLSGNVGTGVIMAHDFDTGRFSLPSAIGLSGIGMGLLVGYAAKDIIIAVTGEDLMKKIASGTKLTLSGECGITTGDISRLDDLETFAEEGINKGCWGFMYSKGYFCSMALEAATLRAHHKQNRKFYGKDDVTPSEILFDGGSVTVPEGSGVTELHEKLQMLVVGQTKKPTPAEVAMKESLRESAAKAGEEAEKELADEAEYLDAQEEAKKEAESSTEEKAG